MTDANIDDWGEFNHSYLNPPSTTLDPVIDPAVGWNPVIDPAVGWTRPEEIASGHGPQWEQPDPICNPMIEPVKTSSSGSVEHNQYQEYEKYINIQFSYNPCG